MLVNTQGLASPNKVLLFKDYIKNLHRKPRVIVVAEHWFNSNEVKGLNLLNYRLTSSFGRKKNLRGGVAILAERGLIVESITVESTEKKFEVCASLVILGSLKLLICAIYRPSNPDNNADFDSFFTALDELMLKLLSVYKKRRFTKVLVCGDFNINVLRKTADSVRLRQIFGKYDFSLVNGVCPTRVTDKSSTLIDLVFVGPGPFDASSRVESNIFSDHECVFVSFDCNFPKPVDKFVWERKFNDDTIQRFCEYLSGQSWFPVVRAQGVNAKYEAFINIFLAGFYDCFPRVKKIKRANQADKVVLSRAVKTQRAELRDLRILAREAPDEVWRRRLQAQLKDKRFKYMQQLSREIQQSNSAYIAGAENKSRAAWNVLQKSMGNQGGHTFIKELRLNGQIVSDTVELANAFNASFVLPEPQYDVPYECVGRSPRASFFLNPMGAYEVQLYLQSLASKKAAAADEIPMFLVKRVARLVAFPLAEVNNTSFALGEFPDPFKPALVTPLFKKGDRLDVKNYRPVSVLPSFSKPLEWSFMIRLVHFFETNGLLPASQHGFIKGRCTDTALFQFFEALHRSMEGRSKVIGIFYDLTNAFGSVCIPLLLQKFEYLGVRGIPLRWLQSALSGRSQKVRLYEDFENEIREVFSDELHFSRGTPQGGIISPFVFDIGIYDMAMYILLGVLFNYADDSTTLISARTTTELFVNARLSAESMHNYCSQNFLSLNASKSVIMQFRNPTGARPLCSPYVSLSGKSIACLSTTKLLGLYISDNFSWQAHADYVVGRLESAVFLVSNLLKVVSKRELRVVYHAYSYSIIQYGIIFWGSSESALRDVFVAQKKLVRCLAGERYWPARERLCSCRPLFERLELLPVFSIYLFECCKFARRHPDYFRRTDDVHSHDTRHKAELFVGACSLQISRMNPAVCVPRLYNALPQEIRDIQVFAKFVTKLRKFLYAHRFYSAAEYFDFVRD
jgi:Reverse transcriptase (RNA-dependent DNA polymerase)